MVPATACLRIIVRVCALHTRLRTGACWLPVPDLLIPLIPARSLHTAYLTSCSQPTNVVQCVQVHLNLLAGSRSPHSLLAMPWTTALVMLSAQARVAAIRLLAVARTAGTIPTGRDSSLKRGLSG